MPKACPYVMMNRAKFDIPSPPLYDLFVKWGNGAKLAEPVGDAFFHQRGFAQNADKFF